MKMISKVLILAVLCSCIGLAGCTGTQEADGKDGTSSSASSASKTSAVSSKDVKQSTAVEAAEEVSGKGAGEYAGDSWKVYYIQKLNEYFLQLTEYNMIDDASFELVDVNGDKIPELYIVCDSFNEAKREFFTVWNDELKELKLDDSIDQIYFNRSQKQLASVSKENGIQTIWAAQVEKGALKVLLNASDNSSAVANQTAEEYQFMVNNKKVTEYEYYEKTADYQIEGNSAWVPIGKSTKFTAENITGVVNSYTPEKEVSDAAKRAAEASAASTIEQDEGVWDNYAYLHHGTQESSSYGDDDGNGYDDGYGNYDSGNGYDDGYDSGNGGCDDGNGGYNDGTTYDGQDY